MTDKVLDVVGPVLPVKVGKLRPNDRSHPRNGFLPRSEIVSTTDNHESIKLLCGAATRKREPPNVVRDLSSLEVNQAR